MISAGSLWACKFLGTRNGDLILGRATGRVRRSPRGVLEVELRDVFTDKLRYKQERVLRARNYIPSKAEAREISKAAHKRLKAVEIYKGKDAGTFQPFAGFPPSPELPKKVEKKVEKKKKPRLVLVGLFYLSPV